MGRVLVLGGDGVVGIAVQNALLVGAEHEIVATHHRPPRLDIPHPAGVRTVTLDVSDAAAYTRELREVELVINCTGREDTKLVLGAAEHGADFLDIGAGEAFPAAVHALDATLRAAGSTALLGVGLAPGLSGMLAAAAVAQAAPVAGPVEITVLLGLGEANGAAATRWMLDELGLRRVGRARMVELPGGFGRRRALPLDFGDRVSLTAQLAAPVRSYYVLDPPWAGAATRAFARIPGSQRALVPLAAAARLLPGHAWWAVQATSPPATAWATGRNESAAAAAVTAWAARQLLAGDWPRGAHYLHAIASLNELAPELQRAGIGVALSAEIM